MKTIKILALALALTMFSVLAIGCQSTEKVTVNVTVSAVVDGEAIFGPVTVPISTPVDESVSVLIAATHAMDENGIYYTVTEDAMSITSIDDYADKSDDEYTYFWEYSLNGVVPDSGRAGTNLVKDGDEIVFTYIQILTSDLVEDAE